MKFSLVVLTWTFWQVCYGFKRNHVVNVNKKSILLKYHNVKPIVIERCIVLSEKGLNEVDKDLVSPRGMKGYYVRPSRAIEKGGGFYVPGLEGDRIRIISALFLLALCVLNSNGGIDGSFSQLVSILTGVIAAFTLFLQGVAPTLSEMISKPTIEANANTEGGSNEGLVTLLPPSSSNRKVMELVRAIASTCEAVLFIAAFEQSSLASETTTSSPITAFGPSGWKGDLKTFPYLAIGSDITGSQDGGVKKPILRWIDWENNMKSRQDGNDDGIQSVLSWAAAGGVPAATRSIVVVTQQEPERKTLQWIVAFGCPLERLKGPSSDAMGGKWLETLFAAPIASVIEN
mmetsp:Transcript_10026/g.14993  ORF Transcript_10026/g.14993 Transcript_10026/m.14993 type:complete len:345 (+) Transcript_10026:696-1730(+)